MPARRTVAPDIVGCSFLLYAATLSFAVLRAPYAHRTTGPVFTDIAIYGGLLVVCVLVALGLFRRRQWVLWPALLLSIAVFFAGLFAWHVPETAQLPAGVLGVTGFVLLVGRRSELMADDDSDDEPGENEHASDSRKDRAAGDRASAPG